MEFSELNLHRDLKRAIDEVGYVTATPVQAKVFEHAFAGHDIYAQSQTGSGKTAAFLISIYQRMLTTDETRNRKVLILTPTRELAVQIEEETRRLGKYLPFTSHAFYGGVSYGPQVDALKANVQFIIGTPGRIIDLVKQGKMLLKDVGFLVIDEADRMFDMGFIDDLRLLLRYLPGPKERQTQLYSATLNVRVKNLAWDYMVDPKEIIIEPERVTVDLVTQELYHVGSDEKFRFLLGLLQRERPSSCIVFANLKFITEEICRRLKMNGIEAEFIMGDLPQSQRTRVIERLKSGELKVLVATDVAARGLDVEALDLVVNYDVPLDAESYVHRIGRTARAGKAGKAVTLACEKYVYGLPAIEKYIGQKIPSLSFTDADLPEDKSANLRYSHRHEEGRRERGGRSGGLRDRGRGGLDRSRRESSGGRDGRRDGGRRPSGSGGIQRSIAEAAGRGMDAPGSRDGGKRNDRPRDDRRNDRPREQAGREGGRGASGREAEGRNLYELPMDERMKVYRQKYGAEASGGGGRGDGKRGGDGQKKDQRAQGARQEGRRDGGQRQAQGGKARDGAAVPAEGRGKGSGGNRGRGGEGRREGAGQSPRSGQQAPAKKPGLLDKIKALFGGKKKTKE